MNTPSVDVKDMLVAAGLGLTFGTNLFVGREPPDPDSCVTIFDAPGSAPQLTYAQGENFYYPSIQILVRDNSYVDGYEVIKDIMDTLHGLSHETWNGTLYCLIRCTQEPFLLDYDTHNRARFVCNFDIQRR